MSTKLDTTEVILEWAESVLDKRKSVLEDRETAAYLAECVRLRRAFDALCADGTFTAAVRNLVYDAAMKGGKP